MRGRSPWRFLSFVHFYSCISGRRILRHVGMSGPRPDRMIRVLNRLRGCDLPTARAPNAVAARIPGDPYGEAEYGHGRTLTLDSGVSAQWASIEERAVVGRS